LSQDGLANELQIQLEKITNQARFVDMIIKKELVVSNRKKADIVAELRTKDFKSFPKLTKAKAAGETEEIVEEDDLDVTLAHEVDERIELLPRAPDPDDVVEQQLVAVRR